jgi:glycosyltransferase involved in cell wall biosynthesis
VIYGALVLTQDEERQVEGCLRSLAAARRIVVIDSGSRDRTLEIVGSFPAVRVVQRPFVSFSDQRNHGLASCFEAGEWVFHLDADERLTPELASEIDGLSPSNHHVAFNVASRTFLLGRPVLRASGFPVYQTRLTRAGRFHFEEVGHGQKAPARFGPLPRLRHPYDHYPFEKGHEAWRRRHERYADLEATDLRAGGRRLALRSALADPIARRQWLRRATARLPFRPELVWAYLMFGRLGLLDGRGGWEYCRLRWLYERMVRQRLGTAASRPPPSS